MEEILASIRRIIADDQSVPLPDPASPNVAPTHTLPESDGLDGATRVVPEMARHETSHDMRSVGALPEPGEEPPEEPIGVMDTRHPLAPVPEPVETLMEVTPPMAEDIHEDALRAMHDEPSFEPPVHQPPLHERSPADGRGGATDGLVSASTSQSLASALNTLAVSRLVADSAELRGLTKDLLRPLLKDWLDENLPSLVETIIRGEIERMTRHPG